MKDIEKAIIQAIREGKYTVTITKEVKFEEALGMGSLLKLPKPFLEAVTSLMRDRWGRE